MPCTRPHVLITGTSSGIGRATMDAAAAAGFHVFAGDRSADPGSETEVGTGLISHVHLDITVPDDVAHAVEVIGEHVGDGGLDGLANIAGIGIPGPLEIMPMADLRASFEVDFFGQVALTQVMIPLVRRAKGRIVFIGSISSQGNRGQVSYASTKAGLKGAAATIMKEAMFHGVRCSVIHPGFTDTAMVRAMGEEYSA